MKSWKAALLILFSTTLLSAQGRASEPESINDALRTRLLKLIDKPDMTNLHGSAFTTEVEFIVTRKNEIVVLDVVSNEPSLENYIKSQLNYAQVKLRGVQKLTPYKIEVTFHQPPADYFVPQEKPVLTAISRS